MTAPDPRLGAYHPANRQDATDDLIRMLTESADIPGNVRLPREAVNMLLAELRKAQDKLARVEGVADRLNWEADNANEGAKYAAEVNEGASLMALESERFAYQKAERLLRAAVADTTGGERG